MSLRFPYKVVRVPYSVISLGGRWSRPRPSLLVSVVGSSGIYPQVGLLDSGADDTVFPESVAFRLGIDLSNSAILHLKTADQTSILVRYAQVHLRITDGKEQREWPAWVGFTPAKLQQPLLGFAGFLQFFTATFHGDREQVELAVNSLYPGI